MRAAGSRATLGCMELVVFDLDGTLLNRDSRISDFTSETLRLLRERCIA